MLISPLLQLPASGLISLFLLFLDFLPHWYYITLLVIFSCDRRHQQLRPPLATQGIFIILLAVPLLLFLHGAFCDEMALWPLHKPSCLLRFQLDFIYKTIWLYPIYTSVQYVQQRAKLRLNHFCHVYWSRISQEARSTSWFAPVVLRNSRRVSPCSQPPSSLPRLMP